MGLNWEQALQLGQELELVQALIVVVHEERRFLQKIEP
jgi:hypothetical protein